MEDIDVCQCRKCGKLEVRRQDGFFPDGRNKKFVNSVSEQWSGRSCPECVRKRVKEQVKLKRAEKKNADA
jgi:hypothetical protein